MVSFCFQRNVVRTSSEIWKYTYSHKIGFHSHTYSEKCFGVHNIKFSWMLSDRQAKERRLVRTKERTFLVWTHPLYERCWWDSFCSLMCPFLCYCRLVSKSTTRMCHWLFTKTFFFAAEESEKRFSALFIMSSRSAGFSKPRRWFRSGATSSCARPPQAIYVFTVCPEAPLFSVHCITLSPEAVTQTDVFT